MNHAKLFVHDYRKPKGTKNILFERAEGVTNKLNAKAILDPDYMSSILRRMINGR